MMRNNRLKHYFRLSVFNGLFLIGNFESYPTEEDIKDILLERFGGYKLNNETITFEVEKVQYIEE